MRIDQGAVAGVARLQANHDQTPCSRSAATPATDKDKMVACLTEQRHFDVATLARAWKAQQNHRLATIDYEAEPRNEQILKTEP